MSFIAAPTNISVPPEESPSSRIYALMTVLKGVAEIKLRRLNSRENLEENKRFLRKRPEREENPAIHQLLETDLHHLDLIQVQVATAREFLIIIRLRNDLSGFYLW